MGVGHFEFSRNPEERKSQMEFFKSMQIETKFNRIANEIYKLKREIVLRERLSKVMKRRYLKSGYSLSQIQSVKAINEYDEHISEMNQEISELEDYIRGQEMLSGEKNEIKPIQVDTEPFLPSMKRKIKLDREWDLPKLSKLSYDCQLFYLTNFKLIFFKEEKTWQKHVAELRMERKKVAILC